MNPLYRTSSIRSAPRPAAWVFGGGALLAGTGGFVNAALLLSAFHVPVSHMSGAVAAFSIALAAGSEIDMNRILGIMAGFLLGSVLSGAIVGGTQLRLGRRYGLALLLEGALLSLAAWRLPGTNMASLVLAAVACGLQNGMAASYLGLTLRTTHVTGIVTDLGVMLGRWLTGRRTPAWQPALLSLLLLAFAAGGLFGAWSATAFGDQALWIPAFGTSLSGLAYLRWRVVFERRAAQLPTVTAGPSLR